MKTLLFLTLTILGSSLDILSTAESTARVKTVHSEQEWLKILGADRYKVMREKGTERAFVGEYTYKEGPAAYHCAACDLALFDGINQYDARSGYPSFTQPISPKSVYFAEDRSLSFMRYEILCAGCDSHLGHIFKDGPIPRGFRYCVNSIALKRVVK